MNARAFLTCWVAPLLLVLTSSVGAESLYREQTFRPLTADRKAFRVGDVITVQVFENASASTSSDTGTRRNNALEGEVGHVSGKVARGTLGINSEFDGGGRTQRSNRVLITLSVSVTEVMPNCDLRVGGEQMLLVNNEQQRVTLQGRVRPEDVSDANVVVSSRLADARISYLGEGDVSERQQRAWWRKLLDWVGM